MHDCQKIEERLIDLVFNELGEDERRQTLAEVDSCEHCRAEYQALAQTLSVVDQASAAMAPDEEYWNAYEAGLRVKLAADQGPMPLSSWRQRWREALTVLTARPAWAMSVALLLGLALFLWAVLTQMNYQSKAPLEAQDKPANVQPHGSDKAEEKGSTTALRGDEKTPPDVRPSPNPKQKKNGLRHSNQTVAARTARPTKRPEEFDKAVEPQAPQVATTFEQASGGAALLDNDTLRHFEKAQMFLRAFRNLDAAGSAPALEMADDKQRSRALLFKNVLLRREAEAKGNLPVGQVLSDLEPLLLDIANLADKATAYEIRTIHERLQKREIIATLQVYAARPVIARAISD
jgi:hypothetical protein